MSCRRITTFLVASAALIAGGVVQPDMSLAGEADVLEVQVERSGKSYRFNVTVQHADAGWDHYADAWEILGPGGAVIATRELAHPHVEEQPFTRSLPNVEIPDEIAEVTVRARDSVHGYGGDEVTVELP